MVVEPAEAAVILVVAPVVARPRAVPVAATKADDDAAAAASGQLTVRGYLSRLGDGMRFIRADRVIAGRHVREAAVQADATGIVKLSPIT